jgi:flavin-dependent dehydrogenase
MIIQEKYDVVILGGGLAGLTLALQLRQTKPDISLLVLEKRKENAPVATHKVGESTSELGSSYLRNVLDLKNCLIERQLPKFGFRFFFSEHYTTDIARRVEVGSRILNPFPTHQVDRGILENDLGDKLSGYNVQIEPGARLLEVEIHKEGHKVIFEKEGHEFNTRAAWIVDATGRSSFLKRKLGLEKPMAHDINAAWFRVDCAINIDDWSDDLSWRNELDPGRRRLATNHLMGEGYWVWIIPLVSGRTSIGIVADPASHPFTSYNSYDKAMQWLRKHEPVAAKMLEMHPDKVMDFKVMKNFAYDTKQFYSTDRWGLTGEAAAFMDAFYSPGTDFIGLGNSWLTDLILRDLKGEDIMLRTIIYEHAHRELLNGWLLLYKDMYGVFGKTQIMLMKIIWDWASYWAVPTLLFMNNGYTDIAVLKKYSSSDNSIGRRFAKLNERMQALFRAWSKHDTELIADHFVNVFDLDCLYRLQMGLTEKHTGEELILKVQSNLKMLEYIAAEIFRRSSAQISGTPDDMNVDPYEMTLEDNNETLFLKSQDQNAIPVIESIRADIAKMWFTKAKKNQQEHA